MKNATKLDCRHLPRLRRGVYVMVGFGVLVDGWWCGTFTAGEPINRATSAFGVTPEAAVSAWWKRGAQIRRTHRARTHA